MLLGLRTPATNDRGPLYAEQAFAALHQANAQRLPLRLIFGTHGGSVGLFIAAPNILQSLVETQFYANYPDCTLGGVAVNVPQRESQSCLDGKTADRLIDLSFGLCELD